LCVDESGISILVTLSLFLIKDW